jgi:formylglycine-generating enzyme required for sulfatase activity
MTGTTARHEGPAHDVHVDSFLIDREPVSTAAYCRFLNSVGLFDGSILEEWFMSRSTTAVATTSSCGGTMTAGRCCRFTD